MDRECFCRRRLGIVVTNRGERGGRKSAPPRWRAEQPPVAIGLPCRGGRRYGFSRWAILAGAAVAGAAVAGVTPTAVAEETEAAADSGSGVAADGDPAAPEPMAMPPEAGGPRQRALEGTPRRDSELDGYGSPLRRRPRRRWYGWQTLITDGAALAVVGSDTGEVALPAVLAAYEFGAPIVHFAHGHVGKGLASLGMRLGSTLALVAAVENCPDAPETPCFLPLIPLSWMIAAIPIDAAVLAREDVQQEPSTVMHLKLYPTLGAGRGTAGLILASSF